MFLFYHFLCDCVLFTGKILIIGGGIANFTNVSATFKVNFSHLLLFKSPVKKNVLRLLLPLQIETCLDPQSERLKPILLA